MPEVCTLTIFYGMARWFWTASLASVVGRSLYGVWHLWYTLLGLNRVKWCQHLRHVAGVAGGLRVEEVTVEYPNPTEGFYHACRNGPVLVWFGQRVGVGRKACQCCAGERPGEVV